ncbi:hypothetical protein GGI12_005711 [Dipsacomyces acuminosporus]|nr:hypothetical protein GGI12_005711 [Dipsacomyces acuminosporus]
MGQYWVQVCLDNRQATSGNLFKLGEFFFMEIPERLVDLLTVPSSSKLPGPLPVKPAKAYATKEFSAIEELPAEILDRICAYLPTIDDLLCFSLSCYRFLELGRRIMITHPASMHLVSPWAGKRIICVGDYADDYPEGFLTKEEEEEFSGKSLYDYADVFGKPSNQKQLTNLTFKRAYRCIRHFPHRTKLIQALLPAYRYVKGSDPRCILRNLTTKEYVCAKDLNDIKGSYNICLGHVLLARICWSTDDSVSMANINEIHRGKWAGHRFDITTIDKVDRTWKDVGKELCQEVYNIFEADRALLEENRGPSRRKFRLPRAE